MWSRYLNVKNGRTDGRTICRSNTALCVSSRGKYDDIQSLNTRLKDGVEWLFSFPAKLIHLNSRIDGESYISLKNIIDFGEKIDVKSNWIETTFLTSYLQRLWYPFQVFRYFTYLFICIFAFPCDLCCTFDVILLSFTSHNCIWFRFCLFDHDAVGCLVKEFCDCNVACCQSWTACRLWCFRRWIACAHHLRWWSYQHCFTCRWQKVIFLLGLYNSVCPSHVVFGLLVMMTRLEKWYLTLYRMSTKIMVVNFFKRYNYLWTSITNMNIFSLCYMTFWRKNVLPLDNTMQLDVKFTNSALLQTGNSMHLPWNYNTVCVQCQVATLCKSWQSQNSSILYQSATACVTYYICCMWAWHTLLTLQL